MMKYKSHSASEATIKLYYLNMGFPTAKNSKLKVSLLLLIVGVLLLSLISYADAAKSSGKHTKHRSSHKGRSNRIDSSFEVEESTLASSAKPSSTTKKSSSSSSSGKGKATYRGSRNQFFSKTKLSGIHGQVSFK